MLLEPEANLYPPPIREVKTDRTFISTPFVILWCTVKWGKYLSSNKHQFNFS